MHLLSPPRPPTFRPLASDPHQCCPSHFPFGIRPSSSLRTTPEKFCIAAFGRHQVSVFGLALDDGAVVDAATKDAEESAVGGAGGAAAVLPPSFSSNPPVVVQPKVSLPDHTLRPRFEASQQQVRLLLRSKRVTLLCIKTSSSRG